MLSSFFVQPDFTDFSLSTFDLSIWHKSAGLTYQPLRKLSSFPPKADRPRAEKCCPSGIWSGVTHGIQDLNVPVIFLLSSLSAPLVVV